MDNDNDTSWLTETRKRLREAQDALLAEERTKKLEACEAKCPAYLTYLHYVKDMTKEAVQQLKLHDMVWFEFSADAANARHFSSAPHRTFPSSVMLLSNKTADLYGTVYWNHDDPAMPRATRLALAEDLCCWAKSIGLETDLQKTGEKGKQIIPFTTECQLVDLKDGTVVAPFDLEEGDCVVGIRVPL